MIETLLSLVAPGWGAIIGAVAGLAGLFGLYVKGRADGANKQKRKAAEDYRKKRKAIDNADTGSGDPDDDARWLHDYGND